MGSTALLFILIAVPLVAAVAGYVLMRQRERSPLAAGCSSLAIGVLLSFLISAVLYFSGVS